MEHLSQQEILELKNLLVKWKAELLEDFKEVVDEPLSYEGGDEIDRADAEAGRIVRLKNLDKHRKLLKKIEYSLQKIEYGTYGICEICQEPIPFKRLKARPVANLCIECKEEQEENE